MVGVPVRVPLADKAKPSGNWPELTAKVNVPVPPVAKIAIE